MQTYTIKELLLAGSHLGTGALALGALALYAPITSTIITGIVTALNIRNYKALKKATDDLKAVDYGFLQRMGIKEKFNAMTDYAHKTAARLNLKRKFNTHFLDKDGKASPNAGLRLGTIYINQAMLEKDQDKINAITAHEIGHDVGNHELTTRLTAGMGIAVTAITAINGVIEAVQGNITSASGLMFVTPVLAIAAIYLHSSIRRANEYHADRLGVDIYENPDKYMEFLEDSKHYEWGDLPNDNFKDILINTFCNAAELHPKIQKRIDAIKKHVSKNQKSSQSLKPV